MNIKDFIKSNPNAQKWNLPTVCPVCGADLELNDNHTDIICTNEACKSKLIGRLKKWAEKLEIKELAPTTLEKFIDGGLIKNVSDLYKADFSVITSWPGFGERSAEIYKKNISKATTATLAQFIAGYNIGDVGEKVVQKIIDAKGIRELSEFANLRAEDLVCEGAGITTTRKLIDGISAVWDDMLETSKYVAIEVPAEKDSNKLAGMVFCFTGKACLPRPQLQAMAEANGGKCASSVSKNTTYLVTDDTDTGSSKNKKAAELGIPVITSEQFLELVK